MLWHIPGNTEDYAHVQFCVHAQEITEYPFSYLEALEAGCKG